MNIKCFVSTLRFLHNKINLYLDRKEVYEMENFVHTEESKNFIIFHVLIEVQTKNIEVFHYVV